MNQNNQNNKEPHIGLSDEQRHAVVGALKGVLADEILIYMKTRNFHWNVVGQDFSRMHEFFETLYEEQALIFDEVAERIRTLGERTPGTMSEFLKQTRLSEKNSEVVHSLDQVRALLEDFEALARQLRKDIELVGKQNDVGTEDFLTGLLEKHEKTSWMLRSYLQ